MTINYSGGSWIAVNAYNDKELLKQAGFRFDPINKTWWSGNPEAVSKVSIYCTREALEALKNALTSNESALAASVAIDSDIYIPLPPNCPRLFGFQKAGVEFIKNHANVIVGDEPGLGKTRQAICYINITPSIKKVLVICPASLKINWQREVVIALTRDMTVGIVNSDKWVDADITIVNYDILRQHHTAIRDIEWDYLICDEAHVLRNEATVRTTEVVGIHKNGKVIDPGISAKKKVFLTGTPIVNRPRELWPLLHYLDPVNWPDKKKFLNRYCWGGQEQGYNGAAHLDELQNKLRGQNGLLIRRMKAQVLTQLPPKRRQIIALPVNDPKLRQALQEEFDDFALREAHLEAVKRAMATAKETGDDAGYAEAVKQLKKGLQVAFSEMAALRKRTAVSKLPHVIAHLDDLLESTKVVVFAHHREVLDAISAHFKDQAVQLDGTTSQINRQKAVDRFQTDDTCRLFVGSIQAAGVGITLTASAHVVFAELDWVPGNLSQAEDRTHRISQNDSVLVQHLVFDGSLDSYMANKIVAKQAVIDQAVNTKLAGEATTQVVGSVSKALSEVEMIDKAKALFELKKDCDDLELESVLRMQIPGCSQENKETYTNAYKRLQHEAALLAQKQAAHAPGSVVDPAILAKSPYVHSALQYLAGMCDSARTVDGAGFNKLDTNFGKSLAGQKILTPKQVAAGYRLVVKYRGQLPQPIREGLQI